MRKDAAATAAAETSTKAASGAMRTLKAVMVTTGIAALVVVMGELVGQFVEYQGKVKLAKDATEGMRQAVEASKADYSAAADGVEGLSSSYDDVSQSAADCLQSQADLASQIKATAEETGTNAALVENYVGVIDELTGKYDENGNKTSLNASEQAKLEAAVAELNEVCGTSYSVIDAASGALSVSTDELHKNADAWIKNAKAQAAQEAYQGSFKQQIENERELAKVNEILEKSGGGLAEFFGEIPGLVDGASESYYGLQGKQKDLKQAIDDDAKAQEYFLGVVNETAPVLDETAAATSDVTEEVAAYSSELSGAIEELSEFAGGNATLSAMLEASGMSVEELAAKMDVAGISVDDLKQGIEDYSASAQNALGKIETKSDITLDQMLANLTENARITQEWGDNLKTLYANAGEGSKRAFVDYIAGLGPEYAPIVQALVDDTTGKMDELAAAWDSGSDASVNAALAKFGPLPDKAREIASGAVDSTNAAFADGAAPAGQSGTETGSSYSEGVDEGASKATGVADGASKEVADHFSSASGDAWWAGHNMTADSYAQGISSGQGTAVSFAMTVSKQIGRAHV